MNEFGKIHGAIAVAALLLLAPLVVKASTSRTQEPAASFVLPPLVSTLEVASIPPIRDSVPVGTFQEEVRVSWYNPALGGPNCANFVNGVCISNMANGGDWRDRFYYSTACPPEWPFGTIVRLPDYNVEVICEDRGGMIKYVNGITWIDLLRKSPLVPYGTRVMAFIEFPGGEK